MKRRFPVVASAIIALLAGSLLLVLSYSVFPEHSFAQGASHEVGFALVVAVIIWVTFEFFSRGDMEERWNDRIERVSRSVFFGVFKRNFPDDLIKEARVLLLDHDFVRRDLSLTYTISDANYTARDGMNQPFVKLSALARYKVKNIGDQSRDYDVGIALPNPLIDELKAHCRVVSIRYRRQDDPWQEVDIRVAQEEFRTKLANDTKHACPFVATKLSIKSGEEIEFVFDYVMAKEEEDTEIFQTRLPANFLTVNVVDQGPTKRIVRARSIHVLDLEDDTSGEATGTYSFRLPRYLLPHQGFALWWKKVPPGARPLSIESTNGPGGGEEDREIL